MANLLLHSLGEFWPLLEKCLDYVEPRRIMEIGSEDGSFTTLLVEWGRVNGAEVHAVDPKPLPALLELEREATNLLVHRQLSVEALAALDRCDVYFIDGDHNYFTVARELRLIADGHEPADAFPLICVHDVEWPSARRDSYYSPETIPEDHRHPHTYEEGVVPGVAETVPGGFRGAGEFAFAQHEGGAANGVLTAVEDFLAVAPGYACVHIPAVFGLAVLFDPQSVAGDALHELLAPFHNHPLLAGMETNRLALYLRVLELQDIAVAAAADRERLSAELDQVRADLADATAAARSSTEEAEALQLRLRDIGAENRSLWRQVEVLAQEVEALDSSTLEAERTRILALHVDEIARSRAFRFGEFLSRATRLTGRGPGLSTARLRRLLDELGVRPE